MHMLTQYSRDINLTNLLLFAVLMKTFSSEGKVNETILAVEEMERRGVVGTASLYYELACCLCTAGRTQEALLQVSFSYLILCFDLLISVCISKNLLKMFSWTFQCIRSRLSD